MTKNVPIEHHFDERVADVRREADSRFSRLEEKLDERFEGARREIAELTKTPWPMVIALAAFVVTILGSFAVLLNVRFESVERRINEVRDNLQAGLTEGVRRGELLATKETLAKDIAAVQTRTTELHSDINTINAELIRRRAEFVEKVELNALEKRLDERNLTQDRRADTFLTRFTWDSWKAERDKLIDNMQKRLDSKEGKTP